MIANIFGWDFIFHRTKRIGKKHSFDLPKKMFRFDVLIKNTTIQLKKFYSVKKKKL